MKTKIAIVSANLGDFDNPELNIIQILPPDVEVTTFLYTNENFPPRDKAMTSRLQARIPKMFGWQMAPGYDYYLWIDGSCKLSSKLSVQWFLDKMDGLDIVVFEHPNRKSAQEEADYVKHRLSITCPYITPRYAGELIDEQMAEIKADKTFEDNVFYASTAFMYRDTPEIRKMMKEWWYHTSRYHIIDQLAFPYVIHTSGVSFGTIQKSYLKVPYLEYTRVKK